MRVVIGAGEIHPPKAVGDRLRTYVSGEALSLVPRKDSYMLDINNLCSIMSTTLILCIFDGNIFLGKLIVYLLECTLGYVVYVDISRN